MSLQLDVVIVGDKDGTIDVSLLVVLMGSNSKATVNVLCLAHSSRVRVWSSVQILPHACASYGYLSMRGLLLHEDASIAMVP